MSLSAHDMRKSLNYNNSQKRKQNPFKKDWGVGASWQHDYTKYENNTPHSSHYDKNSGAAERRKIRPERRSRSNSLLILGVIFVVLIALAWFATQQIDVVLD